MLAPPVRTVLDGARSVRRALLVCLCMTATATPYDQVIMETRRAGALLVCLCWE